MSATFDIQVDPDRDLVRITLAGFFDLHAIQSFLAARSEAFARLRCPISQHLALSDVREMKIQSQDMVEAFGALLADPRTQARRLAFLVGPSLTRSQLQRAIGGRDAQCFTDEREARRWLLDDSVGRAA